MSLAELYCVIGGGGIRYKPEGYLAELDFIGKTIEKGDIKTASIRLQSFDSSATMTSGAVYTISGAVDLPKPYYCPICGGEDFNQSRKECPVCGTPKYI